MGEATYYCKMYFETRKDVKKCFEPIKSFFNEGYNAYEYWQSNRDIKCDDFWNEFQSKFPEITNYLMSNELFGIDCDNGLAGKLDFGDGFNNFELGGSVITYFATVWHFAEWDYLQSFIEKRWNCQFRWISDEYANMFDHKDLDL